MIDVLISMSEPRAAALARAKSKTDPHFSERPLPMKEAYGLLDTGATCTVVDLSIIQHLGLEQTGTAILHTCTTGKGKPVEKPMFDIALRVYSPPIDTYFSALPVIGAELDGSTIDVLLGRDVLDKMLFTFNGQSGYYTLAT